MQYSSCTMVLFLANRTNEVASATLVSKNGPAGIMETIEAAVGFNASLFRYSSENALKSSPFAVAFTM